MSSGLRRWVVENSFEEAAFSLYSDSSCFSHVINSRSDSWSRVKALLGSVLETASG